MDTLEDAEIAILGEEIRRLQQELEAVQAELLVQWTPSLTRESWRPSASNLAAYVGFRRMDMRGIQSRLAPLGLSSLGRCEGYVEATLKAVTLALAAFLGQPVDPAALEAVRIEMETHRKRLENNTNELLGPAPGHRRTRIMVTLPTEAATDPTLVRDWLSRGMDCARINMAHDGPEDWEAMVRNLRRAESVTGRPCKVLMDLGGQKLRIGRLTDALPAIHLKVKRGARGQVLQAAGAILDAGATKTVQPDPDGKGKRIPTRIPVESNWLRGLHAGDKVTFTDILGSRRSLEVVSADGADAYRVRCKTNAYLEPGIELEYRPKGQKKVRRCRVGAVPSRPVKIVVFEGDLLRLTGPQSPGEPAVFNEQGELLSCAHVPCENPDVFRFLRTGERVFIDDGSIEAEILRTDLESALLRVTRARPEGEKLRGGKGLNFPDSQIGLSPLSADDLEQLPLVARLADLVGFSFVQEPEDLDHLMAELARHTPRPVPILAKIETARAVRNLPHLIARGAGQRAFGVMIARGDLAVEIGYERLTEIQEELLWLCEAGDVPVVWATQVLENLIKYGVPTRAEMTDAAMSMRAECVMLNKGPHITEALTLLDSVEIRMQNHQDKKRTMLRALHW